MRLEHKPHCYIVDIDGTIANGSQRQHYVLKKPKNWAAYNAGMHLDKPIQPVIDTINILACTTKIILCSGRQDDKRAITEKWLEENKVQYDELFMRITNDFRDDTIIKKEIYETHIKPRYDVIAVFDDRKKVKRMWVECGLHVFDCNLTDVEF